MGKFASKGKRAGPDYLCLRGKICSLVGSIVVTNKALDFYFDESLVHIISQVFVRKCRWNCDFKTS